MKRRGCAGAQVTQEKALLTKAYTSTEAATALQREHGGKIAGNLSLAERAAIVARMDAGTATRADWQAWQASL